jgi:salicylate synthetase
MRAYREVLLDFGAIGTDDPLRMMVRLAEAEPSADYVVYERAGSWAFAAGVHTSVALDAQTMTVTAEDGSTKARSWTGSPSNVLHSALIQATSVTGWTAYGYLTFEFANLLPARTSSGLVPPDGELARLLVPRTEVLIDERGVLIRTLDDADHDRIEALLRSNATPATRAATAVDITADGERYRERVARAVTEIRQGQYQKVILSRTVDVPFAPDFAATYELGRRVNTPARSFLLRLGGTKATGFSPEVIVTVEGAGRVTTQPLAGTRAFGRGVDNDAEARRELESDPKEVFEHAVSVRTAQEEMLAVCDPETVAVQDFMGIKERGSVQHLSSLVRGTLRTEHTAWDALEALFPAVTASGIPKQASLDAIMRLDDSRRDLYSGAVLTVTHDGRLDAALVLRAMYAKNGRAWLRAGAGIVTDSTPEREYEETCEKLSSVAPYLVRGRG